MTSVFDGILAVEAAGYIFVPSAGGVLADLGADVIKIEPLTGDPMRRSSQLTAEGGSFGGLACLVEGANRGKRSIAIDLRAPAAREVLERLVRGADVFMTNFLPGVRSRLAVDVDDIRSINPRVVYARGSGWGAQGPMADEPAYDMTSAWAASGAAEWFGSGHQDLPSQPYGFYDVVAGHDLAGAIGMALFQRERTGRAPVVDVSLLNVGWWAMQSLISAGAMGVAPAPDDPCAPANPMVNTYPTADGRFVALTIAHGDGQWTELCTLLDRPQLASDDRFATTVARSANNVECASELRAAFVDQPRAHWEERLAGFSGAWGPVLGADEVARHRQAAPNGFINDVVATNGVPLPVVAPPVQFDGRPTIPAGATPRTGQHTDEILDQLGFTAGEVDRLRDAQVVA